MKSIPGSAIPSPRSRSATSHRTKISVYAPPDRTMGNKKSPLLDSSTTKDASPNDNKPRALSFSLIRNDWRPADSEIPMAPGAPSMAAVVSSSTIKLTDTISSPKDSSISGIRSPLMVTTVTTLLIPSPNVSVRSNPIKSSGDAALRAASNTTVLHTTSTAPRVPKSRCSSRE